MPQKNGQADKIKLFLRGNFALSTYNTDYILVKEENYERAMTILASEGYTIV